MFQVVNLVKVRIIIIKASYLSDKSIIENYSLLIIFELWHVITLNVYALTA